MRSLTTLCFVALLALQSFAQTTLEVKPFNDAILAKSVKVEQLPDSVAVILTERQAGLASGAYLQITSSAKWATPLLDGVNITQTKLPGEWLLFAPVGKYRILLAEWDLETGPKYTYYDCVIPKPTDPGPGEPPTGPPTGDFAALQQVARDVATKLNDPKTRNALAVAYKSTLAGMPGKTYEQAVASVKSARSFALSARQGESRMVNWNEWLTFVDVELQKVVTAGDAVQYSKAIAAIADALAT